MVHAKVLGTEHVLYAILHDGNALATRILERAGFSYEDKKDQVKIAALRRNLEERAGWTREDLKALRQRHRTVADKQKFYGQYDGHAPDSEWWSRGLYA